MYKPYPIYTRVRRNYKFIHELQGACMIFGGMTFLLGMLIMYMEIAAVGAGMIVISAATSVCTLNDYYESERYIGTDDQLERGETDE